ncbi:MAG: hypothetical protein QM582_08675, partial [Micropruina sp.]|uniref:hypothetical protein n=1 Tax=Micropruina sp. TaxID=2737536 RepID=UPI0039E386E8
MGWWERPLARLLGRPAADPGSRTAAAPVPRTPTGEWDDIPPLQRVLAEPIAPVAINDRFRASLASFADPSLLASPSHRVDPSVGGLADALVTPTLQRRTVWEPAGDDWAVVPLEFRHAAATAEPSVPDAEPGAPDAEPGAPGAEPGDPPDAPAIDPLPSARTAPAAVQPVLQRSVPVVPTAPAGPPATPTPASFPPPVLQRHTPTPHAPTPDETEPVAELAQPGSAEPSAPVADRDIPLAAPDRPVPSGLPVAVQRSTEGRGVQQPASRPSVPIGLPMQRASHPGTPAPLTPAQLTAAPPAPLAVPVQRASLPDAPGIPAVPTPPATVQLTPARPVAAGQPVISTSPAAPSPPVTPALPVASTSPVTQPPPVTSLPPVTVPPIMAVQRRAVPDPAPTPPPAAPAAVQRVTAEP